MTMILDGTAGATFPTWTTGTRPATPSVGQVGWNTTIGSLENYNGSAWTAVGGGGAGQWQSVQTTGFTAVSGNAYACNTTSAAFTVTLPASPSAGNYVQLTDYARTWSTNNLTLNPNGLKIQGSTSNVILSTNGQSVALVYIDSTQGWIVYSQGAAIGSYSIETLIVAGGGGGGTNGGGGGAGGLVYAASTNVSPGTSYTVTIGAGGAGGAGGSYYNNGVAGSNTSMSGFTTAIGGGYGASNANPSVGGAGGSGGGAGSTGTAGGGGGAGTAGQGNSGGGNSISSPYPAGGGGGAGAAGTAGSGSQSGAGGAGLAYSISGASVYYAGGGGGGSGTTPTCLGGAGGNGGGGNGAGYPSGSIGSAGTANTGGGGGGSSGTNAAGNGGSGVVILRYTGSQRGTGGTITTSGGYTIHTFTSSGTFTA